MKYDHLRTPGSITLVTGPRAYTYQWMHELVVELALAGPVKLLIGGNRYDHYAINYALAAVTGHYEKILDEHIRLSRAETCYQMIELLLQTQADLAPTLVLEPLKTFYDESVPEREINQVLFEVISELRRLSQKAAVVVSASSKQDRPQLLKALENAAERIEYPETQPAQPSYQYSFIE